MASSREPKARIDGQCNVQYTMLIGVDDGLVTDKHDNVQMHATQEASFVYCCVGQIRSPLINNQPIIETNVDAMFAG